MRNGTLWSSRVDNFNCPCTWSCFHGRVCHFWA